MYVLMGHQFGASLWRRLLYLGPCHFGASHLCKRWTEVQWTQAEPFATL